MIRSLPFLAHSDIEPTTRFDRMRVKPVQHLLSNEIPVFMRGYASLSKETGVIDLISKFQILLLPNYSGVVLDDEHFFSKDKSKISLQKYRAEWNNLRDYLADWRKSAIESKTVLRTCMTAEIVKDVFEFATHLPALAEAFLLQARKEGKHIYFPCGKVHQDSLEKLFKYVRAKCGDNRNVCASSVSHALTLSEVDKGCLTFENLADMGKTEGEDLSFDPMTGREEGSVVYNVLQKISLLDTVCPEAHERLKIAVTLAAEFLGAAVCLLQTDMRSELIRVTNLNRNRLASKEPVTATIMRIYFWKAFPLVQELSERLEKDPLGIGWTNTLPHPEVLAGTVLAWRELIVLALFPLVVKQEELEKALPQGEEEDDIESDNNEEGDVKCNSDESTGCEQLFVGKKKQSSNVKGNITYLAGCALRYCLKKKLSSFERSFLELCVGGDDATDDTIINLRERWEEALLRPKLTIVIYVEKILQHIDIYLSEECNNNIIYDKNLYVTIQQELLEDSALFFEFEKAVGYVTAMADPSSIGGGDIIVELVNVHECIVRYFCYIKCKEWLLLLKERTQTSRREARRERKRKRE